MMFIRANMPTSLGENLPLKNTRKTDIGIHRTTSTAMIQIACLGVIGGYFLK